jgi:hypothetical protein
MNLQIFLATSTEIAKDGDTKSREKEYTPTYWGGVKKAALKFTFKTAFL